MALNETIVDDVANANFKTIAGMGASFANLMLADAIAHQRVINTIREGLAAGFVKGNLEVDPTEAISNLKEMTGNSLAESLANLGSALAQVQQLVKAAQTTPPPTA